MSEKSAPESLTREARTLADYIRDELLCVVRPDGRGQETEVWYQRITLRIASTLDRLAAPAAPGIREAAEADAEMKAAQRVLREMHGVLTPRGVAHQGVGKALACLERASAALSRLGASGKAGWTKEPKEAGWYWLRYDGLQAVHVYQDGHRAYPDGRPVLISSRGTVATLCRNGAEWLPIPVPEE